MHIKAATLDDLLRGVLGKLLTSRNRIKPRRGPASELTGVLLQLTNPRARLSRTETKGRLFSSLGELCWYLAKSAELRFITYYLPQYSENSDNGRTVHGGYGPRLFNMRGHDQVANVTALLRRHPDSRRAVIQLFDARDIAREHADVPCTCTLQFLVRAGRLEMFISMRSNDAFIGLPHDVFAFTMFQEIIARSLSIEPGTYKHFVGSLHLYDTHRTLARRYLSEGWQPTIAMPPMPGADPWRSIRMVLKAERVLRDGGAFDFSVLRLHEYWQDLVRLLQVYRYFRDRQPREIGRLRSRMSTTIYDPYIAAKQLAALRRIEQSRQR